MLEGRWRRGVLVPVLGVVAGLLWGEGAGQAGHLDPDGVVQILLTGVDSAGNDERHAKQTGPVLLRGQEVQLRTHLKGQHKQEVISFGTYTVYLTSFIHSFLNKHYIY